MFRHRVSQCESKGACSDTESHNVRESERVQEWFVSGHGFSRAVEVAKNYVGFSPGLSGKGLANRSGSVPARGARVSKSAVALVFRARGQP